MAGQNYCTVYVFSCCKIHATQVQNWGWGGRQLSLILMTNLYICVTCIWISVKGETINYVFCTPLCAPLNW